MLLLKFAPRSLRSLAGAPKIEVYPDTKTWQLSFAVWSEVMYAITCFVKWVLEHQDICDLGCLFGSMVVSILVKSTCKRSIGAVDTIGCRGTIDNLPLCWKQCEQDFRDFCTQSGILSHQKHSHSKDRVQSSPWWPVSQWHPFRVHGVPWGPQRVGYLWASSACTRPPDEWKNSVGSVRSVYLIHWKCALPKASSDLSTSMPSASPALHLTLGLLSGLWLSW